MADPLIVPRRGREKDGLLLPEAKAGETVKMMVKKMEGPAHIPKETPDQTSLESTKVFDKCRPKEITNSRMH